MSVSRNARIAGAIALGLVAAVLTPAVSAAQEPDPAATEQQRADVRARAAEVDLQVDALQAESAEVNAALAEIGANVTTQRAELDAAEAARADAETALAAAEEAVAATARRIVDLNQKADELVVASFVNPPSDNALDAFRAESLSDAAIKQAVIEMEADTEAPAAADAADTRAVAARELADVETALAQQRAFAAEVEKRLDAKLAEVESLKALDQELSDRLAREQAEVAARLAAIQAANPPATDVAPSGIEPVPGGLATVTCPAGGSITVAGSIAGDVQALLDAAAADGISLCGGGYRSPEEQIQLRMEHCGTSDYAIYQMPASQCDPPTAQPGTSLHEQGLAIDFTCDGGSVVDYGDACWNWLEASANSYGLYNLPSEPWHWSVDGT